MNVSQFHLTRWKIYSTPSCPALFYCQCDGKRKGWLEMKQDSEFWFLIIHKLFPWKISSGSSSWERWCHPPCSLTAADKICHIFPGCSPLPALFLSSSFLLHLDIGLSCGQGPQLLLALVTGAVLGLCWDGPTRTWHCCACLADPPLNKRGIFLPKVFTA